MGPGSLNFNDAAKSCEELGGRLAEPQTQDQFEAISAFQTQSFGTFLLGGSDLLQEGSWVFNSDSSPIDTARFFNVGEPNGNTVENCLEFRFGGLNDFRCEASSPYMCEYGGTGTAPVC